MELLLLIVAWSLKLILSPVLFIYGFIKSVFKNETMKYFKAIAISLDSFGNVLGGYIFNDTLRLPEGYDFGNRKDTISYAMGKNSEIKKLSPCGNWIGNILNKLDKDHLQKAIK